MPGHGPAHIAEPYESDLVSGKRFVHEQRLIPYRAGAFANPVPQVTHMKVIITGGGGFLGSQLCQKLLDRGTLTGPSGAPEKIEEIVLLDAIFRQPAADSRVRQVTGNI